MLFNTPVFLVFLGLVAIVNYSLPSRLRWAWLLAAGFYFYIAWQPVFALLLVASCVVTWAAGLWIASRTDARRRILPLTAGIIVNLFPLVLFKYYSFLNQSVSGLFGRDLSDPLLPALRLALPLGVSFYTFKSISYLVDLSKKKIEPERHLGYLSLYVTFFPQILAGPIERSGRFLAQLTEKRGLEYDRVVSGLRLMLWGMAVKVVIADRLALMVNKIYGNPSAYSGPALIAATYFFAFQIYCDFAGYSDMAIGAARVLGFDPAPNFARPYFARSIADFWRRWHISLSTWFRDYLYIPLGGNRVAAWRRHLNLVIVFLVSGLWHGASWTFVVWGFLHGIYLTASILTRGLRERLWTLLRLSEPHPLRVAVEIFITFHLALVAWVFFRAPEIGDAFYILTHLGGGLEAGLWSATSLGAFDPRELTIALAGVAGMTVIQILQERGVRQPLLSGLPVVARWAVYAGLVLAIANFRPVFQSAFIYLQF